MGWWEARLFVPLVVSNDNESRDEYGKIETMILSRLGTLTVQGGGRTHTSSIAALAPPPTDQMEQRTDVYVCVPTVPQVGLKLRGTRHQRQLLEVKLLEKSCHSGAAEKWSKHHLAFSIRHGGEETIHDAISNPEARQRLGAELQSQSRRLGIQNEYWERFLAAFMVAQPQESVAGGRTTQDDSHPDDGAVLVAAVTCHKRRWAYRGPGGTTIEVAYLQFQVDDAFVVADGSKNVGAAELDDSNATDSIDDTATTKAPSTPPSKRTKSLPPRRTTTSPPAALQRSAISVCIEGQDKHYIASLLNQLNGTLKDDLPSSCAPLVGSYAAMVARIVETAKLQRQTADGQQRQQPKSRENM